MHFLVQHYTDEGVHDESGTEHVAPADWWQWKLVRADGSVICRGGELFDTEREARSNIAESKKSMKGAFRSKVITEADDAT